MTTSAAIARVSSGANKVVWLVVVEGDVSLSCRMYTHAYMYVYIYIYVRVRTATYNMKTVSFPPSQMEDIPSLCSTLVQPES